MPLTTTRVAVPVQLQVPVSPTNSLTETSLTRYTFNMSNKTRGELREWTMATIADLVGTQGRAGPIGKETIATALGVSESTVSRWTRGEGVPDEGAYRQLRWLRSQRRTWYLRSSDFVMAMWQPLGDGSDEPAEQLSEGRYFSELSYRPTENPSTVECEIKLAATFRSFALVVLGPRRHQVQLSHSVDGESARRLHFDNRMKVKAGRGQKGTKWSLKKGTRVTFYLRYLV